MIKKDSGEKKTQQKIYEATVIKYREIGNTIGASSLSEAMKAILEAIPQSEIELRLLEYKTNQLKKSA